MNPYVPDPRPRAVTTARRDRHRPAVVAVSGLAAAASLTATGWLAGQAVGDWSAQHPSTADTTSPADPAANPVVNTARASRQERGDGEEGKPRVVVRDRPTRTRVTTQYVTAPAPVGGGGSVSSTSSHTTHSSPPAPSSGS